MDFGHLKHQNFSYGHSKGGRGRQHFVHLVVPLDQVFQSELFNEVLGKLHEQQNGMQTARMHSRW